VQAVESLRCLEEAVVASAADADLGSVLGWGFPQSAGGTVAFVEGTGPSAFLERTRELAQRYGERFDPPALLVRHAESGEPFADTSQ
jgi:3-hydroxyacyl-CoA dehydrogenase/enoyl-CoA hydratase/3-hydroxybutyryl-CoA epimerase